MGAVGSARFIAGDGVELVADIAGAESAPVVVLMHGGGQTRYSWSGSVERLVTAGYRVVNFDARGHGESGWSPDGAYSYEIRSRDLKTILQTVNMPFALVGASLGGLTAMQAVGDGVCPKALVLVDIVLRPEKAGVERIRNFMMLSPDGFETIEAVVDAVSAYNPNRPRPQDPVGLMRNLRKGTDGRLRWHWDPRILHTSPGEELERIGRIVEKFTAGGDLPTLLVRGLQSDILSDANVADFLELFPNTEVLGVAGARHMVVGDSNDVFSRGIVGCRRRHLPPTAG
jgi:pimeloyl-ACP methyl ester carboxylesterase